MGLWKMFKSNTNSGCAVEYYTVIKKDETLIQLLHSAKGKEPVPKDHIFYDSICI